ncbi:MAG: hypothetical protein IKP86_06035 [Anaerolineaceae bacterium]|nr:hypothetical protein [Anaerolineaceae bacterium]
MVQAFVGTVITILSAAAGALIFYCEKLQLLQLTPRGLAARLGAAAVGCGAVTLLIFLILRKTVKAVSKREWLPVILVSLILSVCILVWFPVPDTGLYPSNTLTVRALPDENGDFRPVNLTWLHREKDDIPLSAVRCTGECSFTDHGPTLTGPGCSLIWRGKTGPKVTVEFMSGSDQGIAEINWNGISETAALNNEDFTRLSFDFAFSPSYGLPEFFAVWWISFLLCLAGVITSVKCLPAWDLKKFGIAAFLVYVLFRTVQFLMITGPLEFIDSEFYLGLSRLSVPEILGGEKYCRIEGWHCLSRPVMVPLVYKLCRQNIDVIIIVQLLISLLSWGSFAQNSSRLFRKNLWKKAMIILSLGLGCIPNVTRWDGMIMSESLSISTGILLMGSLFRLTAPSEDKKWHPLPAVFTAISGLLFAHSRDSAVWTLVPVCLVLLMILWQRSGKKIMMVLCAFLMLVCVQSLASTGSRWIYSYENVLFNSILNHPDGEHFFIEAGMPVTENLRQLYGTEHVQAYPLFNSAEFEPLREWILSDGLKTYACYLLRKPSETLRVTWEGGFESEGFEKIDYTFSPFGFRKLLPDPVSKFFSCNLPGVLLIGIGLAALYTAFRVPEGERFAFPVLFLLSAYLLAAAAFLADEYETDRHMITAIIMMKAAAWPTLLLLSEKCEA